MKFLLLLNTCLRFFCSRFTGAGDNYTKTTYMIRSRYYSKMMIINIYFSHISCLKENSKNVQNNNNYLLYNRVAYKRNSFKE